MITIKKLKNKKSKLEKARQEERDKIAAEKAEEEERKKIIKENDKNLKTKGCTLHFPQLTTAKAKKMQQFFIENKIKFEVR